MQSLLRNLDALLVTNPTNVRYLTGFIGAAENEREAYVLLTRDRTFLFTNALYREQAVRLKRVSPLGAKGLTFIEISREEPFAKKLAEVLKRPHPARQGEAFKRLRVGFEENDLTVAEYRKLTSVNLIPTKDKIEALRMIKREDEIENIRQAATLTDECFSFILEKIKPEVTESEIAWEIESFFRKRGAESAFSPIVAFGKHTSQPHYNCTRRSPASPQESALRKQDIALIDFGARVNGYGSDMTRVVFSGRPNDEWKRAYETVLAAQQTALEYLQRERSGATADRLARVVIRKAGFPPYPHSLGHGVGLAIHEAPRLSCKKPVSLTEGMVITIEPAIYIEGRYGIRIEDLILLKRTGAEIVSKSPKEIITL